MRRWLAPKVRVSSTIPRRTYAVTRACRKYSAQAQQPRSLPTQHGEPTSPIPPPSNVQPGSGRPDPYKLLAPQLEHLRQTLLNLLGSAHPGLSEIAKYYFLHPSKQLRPLLVLLFSQATMEWWAAECEGAGGRTEELDRPLTRADVLNDFNPNMPDYTAPPRPPRQPPLPPPEALSNGAPALSSPSACSPPNPPRTDCGDDPCRSPLRRGVASAPVAFGNKLSVLAGDFLLGRTSAALSRLGDSEVVELIASVIANLVEGEILQLKSVHGEELGLKGAPSATGDYFNIYLQKTYMKTASLMAKGVRAATVLGGCREGEVWKEVAYAYGRNLGIAFQLVDDILDYESGEAALGKPGGADLKLGLATGPALFAWEEHPEMGPLIKRKFSQEGDVELARDLVRRSSGVERTRDLALRHADKARGC
ncbi:isoprenoid synthase domain-containing protein [Fomitopsis serialis]|uniref:isoprenoid synthase domain-containing protein n=1 Tax=Fomitopsis serialis TaxID=139415 RepID=UPI0020086633|nr:isoprenoid synthase domain-containing protein [Neoantrodia serialis]KAH9929717.1 isoprenoid synthase domain-containing protein [Neoantrodia serialis]